MAPRRVYSKLRLHGGIALLCILIVFSSAAGAATGQARPQLTPAIGMTTVPVPAGSTATPRTAPCSAPCECLLRSDAVARWGEGGFFQCTDLPCASERTITGAALDKYCFRQNGAAGASGAQYSSPPVASSPTPTPAYYQAARIPVSTATTMAPQKMGTFTYPVSGNDADQDSIPNADDNCPSVFNPGQDEADRIFIGCPPGAVAKVPDAGAMALCAELLSEAARKKCEENAWAKANPGFTGAGCNYKSDGKGDVCDNCWEVQNIDQADSDGDCASYQKNSTYWDGKKWLRDPRCGDTCDRCPGSDDTLDSDGDAVPDGCDLCPGFIDAKDADHDGMPDGCDTCWHAMDFFVRDADGDCEYFRQDSAYYDPGKTLWKKDPGCGDACDNCPTVFNPDQRDTNNDGKGDACSCPWCKKYVVPFWLNGDPSAKIDIILMAATDYGPNQIQEYRDVREFIEKGYGITPPISGSITKFNFYYMNISAEAAVTEYPGCSFTPPNGNSAEFEDATSFADATGVVTTQNNFRAWAGVKSNRRIFTIRSHDDMVIIHETGHAVFGLGDEYCCDSHYSYTPNTYPYYWKVLGETKPVDYYCQQERQMLGGFGSCDLYCPTGQGNCGFGWYTADTQDCFMRGPPPSPKFVSGSACYQRITWLLNHLP